MASKYIDPTSIIQVIGNVFNSPRLLDYEDKYTITENDFADQFHKIAFGAIYKLHELGAETVSVENILDFLSTRPKSEAVFKQQKGEEWLAKASEVAMASSFDYYYGRLKKMSLLRAYDNYGVDVSFIYDPDNILDTKKKQIQEDFIDNATLEQIAKKVDERIDAIRMEYVDDEFGEAHQAGGRCAHRGRRGAKGAARGWCSSLWSAYQYSDTWCSSKEILFAFCTYWCR